MKWKKILISTSIGIAAATPIIAMLAIGANPRLETASSTFLMDFSKVNTENSLNDNFTYTQKNNYLNWLKEQVNLVFSEYKKINKNPELVLDFRTLKSSMTPGELNYFTELKKSMLGINENLSINLIPRSPVSVQEGFYQRNSDMVSFYWSPDYNDIGTWLTYMFSDFQIANMWPALSSAINGDIIPSNLTDNPNKTNWVQDLAKRLSEPTFSTPSGKNVKLVQLQDGKYKALKDSDIMLLVNEGLSLDTINTTIGNVISSWISSNDSIRWSGKLSTNPIITNGFYDNNGGFDGEFIPSMQTNFLDFLSSYNPNIPNFQDGPTTRTTYLVRDGFHVATNPNGTNNYRDWYSKENTKDTYIEYMNGSPFDSSVTSLNPAFTKTSSATFFQTVFSTLFSWSVKHDYTSDAVNEEDKGNFDVQLVSQGSKGSLDAFKSVFDAAMSATSNSDFIDAKDGISANIIDYTKKSFEINIPIRAIPWVNSSGQVTNTPHYLSPIDFLVGLAAYKKCLDVKINSNSYFINLIGLNIEKTLEPLTKSNNNYYELINNDTSDSKNLTLVFENPQLSSNNIADILSIQYFSALPHFSDKVQNILNIDESVPFNPQGNEWNQYYGSGYQTSSWRDCWYTTPYYIKNITDQYWEMEINKEFFKMFQNDLSKNDYIQFDMNPIIDKIKYKKIKTLRFFYNKSGFQEQTLFEMFKSGEADKSLIPSSALTQVERDSELRNQIYAPEVLKISKSDLIPYNLQVYMKQSNGIIRITDSNNNEINNNQLSSIISTDKYGNLIFKDGYKPMLKSNIDDAYYRLIVKNFYTPIDAKDENGNLLPALERSSAIIRTAINDCINWLSLSAIVNPTQSKIMQNSFFPYGSSSLPTNNGTGKVELAEDRLKYWSLSAYKMSANQQEIGLRMGGLLEWSILDYYNVWKTSVNKK